MPRQSIGGSSYPADWPGAVVGVVENGGVKTRPFDHVCNVYCRPAEGLCCEMEHCWRRSWQTPEEANERMRQHLNRGSLWCRHGTVLRFEPVPEVPPLPRENWEAYWVEVTGAHRLGPMALASIRAAAARGEVVYHGANLLWFRNAFPSRREEEEVTTHG